MHSKKECKHSFLELGGRVKEKRFHTEMLRKLGGQIMKHIHGGDIYRNQVILDYSANINPLGIPKKVIEGIGDTISSAIHYPDTECTKLRQAIESKEDIPMEYIICGNGAAELIFSICLANKPNKALLIAPTFAEYEQALRSVDCSIEYYMLQEESGFRVMENFLSYLTDDIDMIFICNPNNPIGNLIDKNLLSNIVSECSKKNIILILDECFIDFIEEPQKYSMKEFLPKYPNMFILKAFTKFFGMPGIRLGYGFTYNKRLLSRMKEVTQPWSVSTVAQTAGIISCYEYNYIVNTKKLIKEERNYLIEELKEGLVHTVYDSKANFIFFKAAETINAESMLNETILDKSIIDGNLSDELKKRGIYIRDCSNYIGLTKGFYRIAVKNHEDNVILINELREIRRRM